MVDLWLINFFPKLFNQKNLTVPKNLFSRISIHLLERSCI